MTRSKTIDNNFIFSLSASRLILLISLGQFVTHLFTPPFLPRLRCLRCEMITNVRQMVESLQKSTSVHGSVKCAGCASDKASFAARSASSFPVISLWLGIQQNVTYWSLDNISWHVCMTLFTKTCKLPWLSIAYNIDMLSENVAKRVLEETFTYFKAL